LITHVQLGNAEEQSVLEVHSTQVPELEHTGLSVPEQTGKVC